MTFKPKMIFKFNDGENIEVETLLDGYDFKLINDLQKIKTENGTVHVGNPGKEVQKSAENLTSVEIYLD